MRSGRLALTIVAGLQCVACSGPQSALDPAGPQASYLASLAWFLIVICSVIWVFVMAVLVLAAWRRRDERRDPLLRDPAFERRAHGWVGGAIGVTALVVIALTILSYVSQRQLFAQEPADLTIHITGNQWWWKARYEDDQPSRSFMTANELYVPVGRRIKLKLSSADVIHSFWVPSLAGKMDLIPGRDNELQFVAARTGVYRGQCAEFCGWQHSRMAMLVMASEQKEFEAWRDRQIAPATAPSGGQEQKGQQVFLSKPCASCHTIRGTPASGNMGPDLTHVASRRTIAAGTLPMSRGSLAAWIVDPQGIKPGTNMPAVKVSSDDIDPLVGYLAGLR